MVGVKGEVGLGWLVEEKVVSGGRGVRWKGVELRWRG